MMNRRMIQGRFCATLSAGALALALASPALAAGPVGQAEMQLAKNHIESLKKPMPALSGKALQAFKESEKAFQARAKQTPPKPLTGQQVTDLCKKNKTCREQMIFIEKEMKKKKSGSLNFGWPDLASALNPFQIKEAQAAHLPTLSWDTITLADRPAVNWWATAHLYLVNRTFVRKEKGSRTYTQFVTYPASYMTVRLQVPKTGWYLYTFNYEPRFASLTHYSYFVDGVPITTDKIAWLLGTTNVAAGWGYFQYWSYLAAGSHTLTIRMTYGTLNYFRGAVVAYR